MPGRLSIEFNNDTLVMTSHGVQKLGDIIQNSSPYYAWAMAWQNDNGVTTVASFHSSFNGAKDFANKQMGYTPVGSPKLVNVSQSIHDKVEDHGYCCTQLECFSEAETHEIALDSSGKS